MSLHEPMLRLLHALLLGSSLLLGVLLTSSQAQVATTITPDGTLGTAVTQSGTLYNITGGTRPGNGSNLFHSFDRFTVGTNDTARFSGPNGIVNILSRVTGGQLSLIDGQLQSTIPGANLYLLNPSGVLFGPHASLDISGSFHVSTADFLRFADGAIFSAHVGQNSTLTVAPPAAFGFLGPTPAAITVQGSFLGVSEGKAVSVVGGEIQIVGGRLIAPSGRVQIASVASPGEVLASPVEMEPNLQVNAFTRGQLTLSQNALLDVSGNSGGTMLIRSGRLLVDQSSIRADTLGNVNGARKGIDIAVTEDIRHTQGAITSASNAAGNAGDITITARSLYMDGSLIGAGSFGKGRAGAITVEVGTLTLTNGAQIDSSTSGPGRGGTVYVSATETMTLMGTTPGFAGFFPSGIFADAQGGGEQAGDAGTVVVQARNVAAAEGGKISSSSFGVGRGGTVRVSATETVALTGTSLGLAGPFPSGIFAETVGREEPVSNAGAVGVKARNVVITDGAQISTSTKGPGPGGQLTVTATEALTIRGQDRAGNPSALFSNASGTGPQAGAAGDLVVSAPVVTMDNGRIATRTVGDGNAGNITLSVDRLELTGGAQIFNGTGTAVFVNGVPTFEGTGGPGRGGQLTVNATDTIVIAGQ